MAHQAIDTGRAQRMRDHLGREDAAVEIRLEQAAIRCDGDQVGQQRIDPLQRPQRARLPPIGTIL